MNRSWYPFDEGREIGQIGTENGIILLDEVHPEGTRITLEQGGTTAPYSITCGIFGWMFHTCFFADEQTAGQTYEEMKIELVRIAKQIPYEGDPKELDKMEAIYPQFDAFVKRFI